MKYVFSWKCKSAARSLSVLHVKKKWTPVDINGWNLISLMHAWKMTVSNKLSAISKIHVRKYKFKKEQHGPTKR